jgi:hypothetical protein
MLGRLTGSGSDALLGLVTGPVRPATVVGAGPHATYLLLDDRPGTTTEDGGELVALVGPGAVRVPCAIVLADGTAQLPGLVAGARARVGQGEVGWEGGSVSVVRWWRAAAVTGTTPDDGAGPVDGAGTPAGRAALERRVAAARLLVAGHELPPAVPPALAAAAAAIGAGQAAAAADALRPVLGLGAGLTPSADDAVAGLLLTARAWYGAEAGPTISAIGGLLAADLQRRTTAVSAGLLHHAAQGRGAPEVVHAVQHLTGRDRHADEHAVLAALITLGHTSGKDTALGVLTFLQRRLTDTITTPSHRPTVRESA